MAVLIVGLAFLAAGVVSMFLWLACRVAVLTVIIGSLPLIGILFGLAAIAVGISSIRDKAATAKEEEKKE